MELGPRLSVVIPFRDEAASLAALHSELSAVLDDLSYGSEILFVDDASEDEGPGIVSALARTDSRVRLLSLTPHSGQSAALEAGFRGARGEIVAMLDADLQNDPKDLPDLLGGLDVADCVCGVRVTRRDRLAIRLASRVANGIRRWVLGDGIQDAGCSIRVVRASYLARIRLFHGAHRFLPFLLQLEGARILQRPVNHRPRRNGRSKYGIAGRLRAVWIDLLAMVWWRRRVDRYQLKELSRRA
jgi:glycosyltransferase involved in cell wall biosynthesis